MEIFIVIKMQQVQFETSMKNIPLGGKKEYVMQLTKSVRKVVYAMSWAAFIFLNNIQCEEKETYGFGSQKKMPIVDELEDFKDALVDLVGGIKWRRNASNPLQRKLREDIKKINKNPNVIVAADKTHNHYEVDPGSYNKLLHNHITKDYKKSSSDVFDEVTAIPGVLKRADCSMFLTFSDVLGLF